MQQGERVAGGFPGSGVRILPLETACDHEVDHQPVVVLEADGYALAQASKLRDGAAECLFDRRHRGSQKEWIQEYRALEYTTLDAGLELGARQPVQRAVGRRRDTDVPAGCAECMRQVANDVPDAADLGARQRAVLGSQEYDRPGIDTRLPTA